jgi:hypothetical protein
MYLLLSVYTVYLTPASFHMLKTTFFSVGHPFLSPCLYWPCQISFSWMTYKSFPLLNEVGCCPLRSKYFPSFYWVWWLLLNFLYVHIKVLFTFLLTHFSHAAVSEGSLGWVRGRPSPPHQDSAVRKSLSCLVSQKASSGRPGRRSISWWKLCP